jgi:serine/threonine protein kinase
MDLKPSNVLVEREKGSRVYKISYFGLSKMLGISSRTARSDVNDRPSGTLAYMAPERFTTHLDLARHAQAAMKVDVYSFGIMLWELKECEIYKPDPSPYVVIRMKESGVEPRRTDTPSPVEYYDLMKKCYSKTPEERPTFSILLSNLKRLLATPIHLVKFSTVRLGYTRGTLTQLQVYFILKIAYATRSPVIYTSMPTASNRLTERKYSASVRNTP